MLGNEYSPNYMQLLKALQDSVQCLFGFSQTWFLHYSKAGETGQQIQHITPPFMWPLSTRIFRCVFTKSNRLPFRESIAKEWS